MTERVSYYNTTAAAMYRFLDREETAKRRERAFRNQMRKLKNRSLRKFALALKAAMVDIPGSEICIPKKVMERLQIGPSGYYFLRDLLEKTLPGATYVEGRDVGEVPTR